MTACAEHARACGGGAQERTVPGPLYAYAFAREHPDEGRPAAPAGEGVVPGARIRFAAFGDLLALVSPLAREGSDWHGLRASLRDPVEAEKRVLAHHRVLACMAPLITLLPLKFGTVFADARALRETLEAHRAQLSRALDRVAGAAEWSVKLYADESAMSEHAEAHSAQAAHLREQLSLAGSGRGFFLRKKLDDVVARASLEGKHRLARESHERLSVHAREAVLGPAAPREGSGAGEQALALSAAYLVGEGEAEAFRAAVAALEGEHASLGCRCTLGGPWPPYSFASLGDDDAAAG